MNQLLEHDEHELLDDDVDEHEHDEHEQLEELLEDDDEHELVDEHEQLEELLDVDEQEHELLDDDVEQDELLEDEQLHEVMPADAAEIVPMFTAFVTLLFIWVRTALTSPADRIVLSVVYDPTVELDTPVVV